MGPKIASCEARAHEDRAINPKTTIKLATRPIDATESSRGYATTTGGVRNAG